MSDTTSLFSGEGKGEAVPQNVFPESPNDFNPAGLVGKNYKNGDIIKWNDPETGQAVYEWNKDVKYGDHFHLTPDGKNRMEHPETGEYPLLAG
ncbi:hypothetical protein [Paenibacillus monticola]|uniref:Uncharacterized protein n=1 Tax=Paenibacillus monticola TaxID=2666075 RepID=A0A7X2H525_9BACL|nr:hypothetical protein [Paenibacillus monticola]MRN53615.1 hypothetical protein [Paenibacillus monticola]